MAKTTALLLLCGFGLAWASFDGDALLELENELKELNASEYQLSHLAGEFFEFFGNFTSQDLLLSIQQDEQNNNDTKKCLADLEQVSQGLSEGDLWALRLLDAWGTLPNGILFGNLYNLGNYEECISIDPPEIDGKYLMGKYCLANLPIGHEVGAEMGTIRIGVCFPSSCKGKQMTIMLRKLINELLHVDLNSTVELVDDASCEQHYPFSGLYIFTTLLLLFLLFATILGTYYDYFVSQDQLPRLVKVFSARAHSRSLFRVVGSKTNPNVIDCLHGIRCLAHIWVFFGHEYKLATNAPNINTVQTYKWTELATSTLIQNSIGFAVDTFFYLSGLLVTITTLRAMEKQKGKLSVPLMYLHRYLRLTPVLAIAIPIYLDLQPHYSDGNSLNYYDFKECGRSWYTTLLYIQNYASANDMCLGHTWYLAADMQLYIFAPFLIIALYIWGKKAAGSILVLMLLLSLSLFSTIINNGYSRFAYTSHFNSTQASDDFKNIYSYTHARAAPWLIGVLFGYFLHLNRSESFKLRRLYVWLSWLLCLAFMLVSLLVLYPTVFIPLLRIAWPLALSWVVFACLQGYGGLANSFLSSSLWQPLSRLTYCAYIFHMLIIIMNGKRTHTSTYFSHYEVLLRFWYDFGLTLVLSYIMYILVEAPIGALESILLPNRRPSPKIATDHHVGAPSETEDTDHQVGAPSESEDTDHQVGDPSESEDTVVQAAHTNEDRPNDIRVSVTE